MNMDTLIYIGATAAKALFMWGVTLTFVLVNIYLERKVCALAQDRVGPNRAHILGIRLAGFMFNFTDAIKLIVKEDIVPSFVNKPFYFIAPFIIMTIALMGGSVIPFADNLTIGAYTIPMQVMDLNVGFLFILAITSLSVYSLMLGGWGSNSKFPLLSAMRSSAQMISYEITMGLSLIGIVMIFGTVSLSSIAQQQGQLLFGCIPQWGIVVQPLGFILFFVASLAELNRNPFDLPEGESEIIGFHVEYSSMKFALFFMAEYANVFVASAIIATLFLGAWQIPWVSTDTIKANADLVLRIVLGCFITGLILIAAFLARFYRLVSYKWNDIRDKEPFFLFSVLGLAVVAGITGLLISFAIPLNDAAAAVLTAVLQIGSLLTKCFIICFVIILLRWTVPRLRYDQLMSLGWKMMLPLGIANIFITGIILLLK